MSKVTVVLSVILCLIGIIAVNCSYSKDTNTGTLSVKQARTKLLKTIPKDSSCTYAFSKKDNYASNLRKDIRDKLIVFSITCGGDESDSNYAVDKYTGTVYVVDSEGLKDMHNKVLSKP